MADVIYNAGLAWLANNDVDGATIKALLTSSAYTPDVDAHEDRADITNEVTGTNWASGGVTVSGVALSRDDTNNRVKLTASDISVATVTVSGARKLVLYVSTGVAANDTLLCCFDFGADKAATAGTFSVSFTGGFLFAFQQG